MSLETDDEGLIRLQKLLAQSGVASRRTVARLATPSTSATYVLLSSYDGWATRCAKSPSFVSRMSPPVSVSSRPTWNSRSGRSATKSLSVRRPSGSDIVETTPRGLLSTR